MAPSERIRRHLQSHAVAYVALFVALSGTALALPGKNKVKKNDIARGAVVGKAIADDAVKRAKLRDGAVNTSKLAGAAVIESTLADNAVTGPKLAEDSVSRNKIVQGSINGGKLANGAIDSAKVADGSLLAQDFAAGQISDGFVTPGFAQPVGNSEVDSATFTTQRPGRVFVTATLFASCPPANPTPCDDRYFVRVQDIQVPGTLNIVTLAPGESRQLTLVGLSDPVPAAALNVSLREVDGDATEDQVALAGVLIQ